MSGTICCCCSGWPEYRRLNAPPAISCVLVVARDGVALQTADGTVEGLILDAPRGTGGFGYDPLFYLPELDRSMAELDLDTKLMLSHRGVPLRHCWPGYMPESSATFAQIHRTVKRYLDGGSMGLQ